LREGSVKGLSVLAIEGYHIFDRQVNVVNVDNRNQRTKKAMGTPIAKPKGGGTQTGAPRITIFENIFGANDRGLSG